MIEEAQNLIVSASDALPIEAHGPIDVLYDKMATTIGILSVTP